jgi:23S rRNA (adenine-C8)-methyltransferase
MRALKKMFNVIQIGCALKCSFCATGAVGFKRQLSLDEIVDQILYFQQLPNRPVDTVSFMGMGEALMNPRVFQALDMLTHSDYFHLSPRRLSVSTVGIIPGIERLMKEYPNVNLAFSLHSPFDEQRNVLVPTNKIHPLSEVMQILEQVCVLSFYSGILCQHALTCRRKLFIAYLVLVRFTYKSKV